MTGTGLFKVDNLSIFVGIFVIFFSFLTIIYSIGFMRKRRELTRYYLNILFTLGASLGAVFSNNLILLVVFWGFLGLTLYLLIGFGEKERTQATAKKTFIIIGGADAIMILGLAFVWRLAGSLQMSEISLALDNRLAVWAYLCLAAGAFAKAGAMPLHTWVPDACEDAPVPVAAFLPASLDKLLGIYFLVRISQDVFLMNYAMNNFLMALGSFTIVAAVMMALIQHDLKRLLGYHAVSQVGYMVLGIGTGNPIGIAGGLFHMLNNAIYKSCLFLGGGVVEKKTGTTDLDKLGGLAKVLPITFITFLISSLAISGVPPFNGFASKWMVYQGVIQAGKSGASQFWVVWLVAAMFGSALTLASFMKLVHAVFLGQPSEKKKVEGAQGIEASTPMIVTIVTLAFLCILFGVFAYQVPVKMFILPGLNNGASLSWSWQSGIAAAILVISGLIIGFAIRFFGSVAKTRQTSAFVGGEFLEKHPEMRISGTEFYDTVQEIGLLKSLYALAQKKAFDIYEVGSKAAFVFAKALRFIHNGVLPTYLSWCLLGMLVLFYVLLR